MNDKAIKPCMNFFGEFFNKYLRKISQIPTSGDLQYLQNKIKEYRKMTGFMTVGLY